MTTRLPQRNASCHEAAAEPLDVRRRRQRHVRRAAQRACSCGLESWSPHERSPRSPRPATPPWIRTCAELDELCRSRNESRQRWTCVGARPPAGSSGSSARGRRRSTEHSALAQTRARGAARARPPGSGRWADARHREIGLARELADGKREGACASVPGPARRKGARRVTATPPRASGPSSPRDSGNIPQLRQPSRPCAARRLLGVDVRLGPIRKIHQYGGVQRRRVPGPHARPGHHPPQALHARAMAVRRPATAAEVIRAARDLARHRVADRACKALTGPADQRRHEPQWQQPIATGLSRSTVSCTAPQKQLAGVGTSPLSIPDSDLIFFN